MTESNIIRKYEILEITDFSDAFSIQIYQDENFTRLATDEEAEIYTGDELFVDISRKNTTFINLRFIIDSCFVAGQKSVFVTEITGEDWVI